MKISVSSCEAAWDCLVVDVFSVRRSTSPTLAHSSVSSFRYPAAPVDLDLLYQFNRSVFSVVVAVPLIELVLFWKYCIIHFWAFQDGSDRMLFFFFFHIIVASPSNRWRRQTFLKVEDLLHVFWMKNTQVADKRSDCKSAFWPIRSGSGSSFNS